MRRDKLRIEQFISAVYQLCGEMDEGDLARVAFVAEHALAEKRRAQRYAIEPAGELAVSPALDRMRMAARVKRRIQMKYLVVDPRLLAIGRRFGNRRASLPQNRNRS
ncbi:MAG: hypothetical protein WDM89_15955 [Rhizomicrobium sp.]